MSLRKAIVIMEYSESDPDDLGKAHKKSRVDFENRLTRTLQKNVSRNPQVVGFNQTTGSNLQLYWSAIVEVDADENICPQCEEKAIVDGDYLCEDCR